jgi:flagellar M-ring protein FliF
MALSAPRALAGTFRQLSGTRRFVGLAAIAAALALLWVASRWAAGPTFVTLYRDLDLSGVSAITDGLDKAGIKYQLQDGGATIQVPTSDVPRARVLLAKDGMPASGRPGFELFDKSNWGMTDFTQRVTYRRALEGELARTLKSLRGVQDAQVHLALPESSPLRKLDRPAEAAVVLTLKPGTTLTADEVQGVAYIVSNSVEQLPTENIAVMDDAGHVLSVPGDGSGVGLSTRQLDMQHVLEQQLGRKAEDLLATAVGPGAARVQVAARLDFTQSERTIETYDPDRQVLQTEQKSETTGDTSAGLGGQTIISNQYQNSRTVERLTGAPGAIDRLSVAVLLDDAALTKAAQNAGRSRDEQIAALQGAVQSALGIDSTRGDRLTIAAIPFETVTASAIQQFSADTAAPSRDIMSVAQQFMRPAILLVGILLAFVLGLKLIKSAPAPAAPGSLPKDGDGGDALSAGAEPALQMRPPGHAVPADRPETAAQVIRAWVSEPAA